MRVDHPGHVHEAAGPQIEFGQGQMIGAHVPLRGRSQRGQRGRERGEPEKSGRGARPRARPREREDRTAQFPCSKRRRREDEGGQQGGVKPPRPPAEEEDRLTEEAEAQRGGGDLIERAARLRRGARAARAGPGPKRRPRARERE